MFDFLTENGISQEVITLIIEKNSKNIVADFLCNSDNCKKIISYLRDLGINNIDELLINRIDLFMQSFSRFEDRIKKIDKDKLVSLVNEDCYNIDMIYE